jgi:hypothetical protein
MNKHIKEKKDSFIFLPEIWMWFIYVRQCGGAGAVQECGCASGSDGSFFYTVVKHKNFD